MGLFQNQGSLGVSFLAFLTTKESNLFFLVTKFQFFPLKYWRTADNELAL